MVAILLPVAVAAVLAIVFLAVVQGVRSGHPQPAVTSPSPTPSDTSAPRIMPTSAWSSPPVQLFDGRCSNLFSEADVQSAVGHAVVQAPAPSKNSATNAVPDVAILQHNGGLHCEWAARSIDNGDVYLQVFPLTALPSATTSSSCVPSGVGDGTCEFTIVEHGVVLTGAMAASDPARAMMRFEQLLSTRIAGLSQVAPAWAPRDGDWGTDQTCDSLATSPGWFTDNGFSLVRSADRPDPYPSTALATVARLQGQLMCEFSHGAGSGVADIAGIVETLNGGAWVEPMLADDPSMTPTSVAGADSAFGSKADPTYRIPQRLFVLSGNNVLYLESASASLDLLGPASDLLSALNGTPPIQATAPANPGTPTPAAGSPSLSSLLLSSEGLGPIVIGKPVPSNQKATYWLDNFCGFTGGGHVPGGWQNDYRTPDGHYGFWVEADPGTSGATKTSPVKKIYIFDPAITTRHGLHVGSSLADVKALGGVSEKTTDSAYYDVGWVIHGYAGQLVAWVDKNRVTSLEVDRENTPLSFAGEITPCD